MRVLLWFTLGFAGAVAVGVYAPALPLGAPWWAAVLSMLLAAACFFGGRKQRRLYYPAVVLLGLGAGLAFFRMTQTPLQNIARRYDGQQLALTVTVLDYSEAGEYGSWVDGQTYLDGQRLKLRFYAGDYQKFAPGEILTGTMRLRFTTPGGEKDSDYYRSKGIFLIARQKGELKVTQPEKLALRFYPRILACHAKNILAECFPADTLPFVQALLLGDSSNLSYKTNTDLKLSGIRHVIAISGLHIMLLFSLVQRLTGRRRFLMPLVGIPVLVFFSAMVGFTPSVTRASVMVGLMMLAGTLNREYDSLTALSAACLLMILGNPYILASVSFQMSAASVMGILLLQPGLYKWWMKRGSSWGKRLRRVWSAAGSSLSVSLSALIFTTPLSAVYFGTVCLIAPVTNLLVLWLIAPVFFGILAGCVVGSLWLPGGVWIGKLVSVPIRWILILAGWFGKIPYGAVYTCSGYIVLWLLICYALLGMFLLLRKRGWIFAALGATTLVGAIFAGWLVPRTDSVRLTMLDVGQGQCLLLQSGGENYLIDCGGSSKTRPADLAAETLLSQGIFRLDGVILTHYDSDHTGALSNLLSRIPAQKLYLPLIDGEMYLPENGDGCSVVPAEDGTVIPMGEGTLTLLQPNAQGTENNLSVALLFASPKCVILVTGDRDAAGEKELLDTGKLQPVDVLVVGHHGARTSASGALLKETQPRFALISVGAGNSYGHPAGSTLGRLTDARCRIYRTDTQGIIVYRR